VSFDRAESLQYVNLLLAIGVAGNAFCPKMKNETKSTAPQIGGFVSKRKTRQKAPRRRLGVLPQNEKRDKKHCAADLGFCLKTKNETKSTAPQIGGFVSK